MWFDTHSGEWIEDNSELEAILDDIANFDRDYFDTDDYIDSFYPTVTFFGIEFYVSTIIKKCDEFLYDSIVDEQISDWITSKMNILETYEPEENETLANALDEQGNKLLECIVWKEKD